MAHYRVKERSQHRHEVQQGALHAPAVRTWVAALWKGLLLLLTCLACFGSAFLATCVAFFTACIQDQPTVVCHAITGSHNHT